MNYLITGGGSGVGFALARLLTLAGESVCLVGRNRDRLDEAANKLVGATIWATDVGHDSFAEEIELLAKSGGAPFVGVIHAAGSVRISPVRSAHIGFDHAPVSGLLNIARAADRGALMKGAAIVSISSVAASRGAWGMSQYSAAKGALEAATRSLAIELAPRFRVCAIAAGAFESPMHHKVISGMSPSTLETYEKKHPLGFGTAEDVAEAALFLLSAKARWITGCTWAVDYWQRGTGQAVRCMEYVRARSCRKNPQSRELNYCCWPQGPWKSPSASRRLKPWAPKKSRWAWMRLAVPRAWR